MPRMSIPNINYEPKNKMRWELIFNIPALLGASGNTGRGGSESPLVLSLLSAARPEVTFAPVEIPYRNETYKFAGKPKWSDIPVKFTDYIDINTGLSVYQWLIKVYNPNPGPNQGDMGFKREYAGDVRLNMLTPPNPEGQEGIVESWVLQGCWPSDINYDDLDYANSASATISMKLTFDRAFLDTQGNASGGNFGI